MSLAFLNQVTQLEVRMNHQEVGQLRWEKNRLYFSYSSSFLTQNLWLSPFHLPLKPGTIEHQDINFGPLFGLFDDSLPDGWGRLLMTRYFRSQGFDLRSATPLALLAYLGEKTMGALSYYPPQSKYEIEEVHLAFLARHAQDIIQGDVDEILPLLRRAGGSPGGARPKVLVGVRQEGEEGAHLISGEGQLPSSHQPWLIKFRGIEDDQDTPRVELTYMELARRAGIEVPKTHGFEAEQDCFFGIERFDRFWDGEQWQRTHIHTLGGLIHSNFRIPSCDYEDFLKVIRALGKGDQHLLYRAFKLMVFNYLSHNRDDHVKNISFMMNAQGQWTLAPAYDLTWSQGPRGEHSMTIGGEGKNPKVKHLLKVSKLFDLDQNQCLEIIDEVGAALSMWTEMSTFYGVSSKTQKLIQKVFNMLWTQRLEE